MEIGIARLAAVVWVAYFVLSITGDRLQILPLKLIANVIYFVVAVVLYRYFADSEPAIALVLLPLAALGCVLQSIGMIQGDRDLQRIAFTPFGLFLATIGVMLLRASIAPQLLGYALVGAGVGGLVFLIPNAPAAVTGIGLLTMIPEGGLVLWLLLAA